MTGFERLSPLIFTKAVVNLKSSNQMFFTYSVALLGTTFREAECIHLFLNKSHMNSPCHMHSSSPPPTRAPTCSGGSPAAFFATWAGAMDGAGRERSGIQAGATGCLSTLQGLHVDYGPPVGQLWFKVMIDWPKWFSHISHLAVNVWSITVLCSGNKPPYVISLTNRNTTATITQLRCSNNTRLVTLNRTSANKNWWILFSADCDSMQYSSLVQILGVNILALIELH